MKPDKLFCSRSWRAAALILLTCLLIPTEHNALAQAQKPVRTSSPAPGNQKITVKGTITDENGEPLPGANVLVKGTSIGASADMDGNYTLSFVRSSGKSDVLIVSFIGMEEQEFNVTSSTRLNITMKTSSLDAVVVNGFYSQAKETFTGAATTVSGEQLASVNSTNLFSSLAALTPGMVIVENNAAGSNPNAVPSILIRGANTLITNDSEEGVNNPLIVLDGVEVPISDLYDLDIYDIERIDVLKDASATILYGEKGANGVIVVERKRIEGGKIRVNYNFTPKFSIPDLSSFNMTNSEQKLEVERLAGLYDTTDGSRDQAYDWKLQQIRKGVNTNWLKAPLRVPFSHSHSFSLSSQGEALTFRANVNFNDTYGVMKGDNRRTLGMNFNIGYHLRDRLTVNYQNTFNYSATKDSPYGNFSTYVKMNPYWTIYDDNGDLIKKYWFNPYDTSSESIVNPLYDATLSSFSKGASHNWTNSLNARVNITKNFYVTAQGSVRMTWTSSDDYESPDMAKYESTTDVKKKGRYSFSNTNGLNADGKVVLNYGRSLDSHGSMFRVSAGGNIQYTRSKSASAVGQGFLKDNLSDISFALDYPENSSPGGSDKLSTGVGVFANANVGFRNRYFIDASYRASGSSKFGSNNSFAPFWSFGAGWNIHNEKFAKNWEWLNTLTLRYSAGYTGSVSFDYYQAKTVYKYDSKNLYYTGIGALPRQMGNDNLKWQRTFNNNVGLTGAFLKNRFNFTIDFYSNTTYDTLMSFNLPPSVGATSMQVNFGEINNKGVDLSVSGQIISNKNWFWSMTLTGGHVMDEIRKISSALNGNDQSSSTDTLLPKTLLEEGGSQFDIYAMRSAGIDPATGKEIYIKKNGEYTFNYSADERVAVGNTNPALQGSWMNTVRYKGFSLSIATSYTFGADIYNTTLQGKVENIDPYYNVDERVFTDRWKTPGDHSRYLRIDTDAMTHYSERFVEKRNEVYISSVQFTYDFAPKAITRLGLRKLCIGLGLSDVGRISTVKFERGTSYPYCRSFNLIFRPTF